MPITLRNAAGGIRPLYAPDEAEENIAIANQMQVEAMRAPMRGFARGAEGLAARANNLAGGILEPLSPGMAQRFYQDALANQAEAQRYRLPGDITDTDQVRGVGDALEFAGNMMMENLPQAPLTLAGAIAARYGLRNVAMPGIAKNFVGAAATNVPLLAGENIGAMQADPTLLANTTAGERLGTAVGTAVPQAMLDSVGDALLMNRLGGAGKALGNVFQDGVGKATKQAAGHLAKAVPEAALTEGVPEMGQEWLQQQALGYLNPERDTSGDAKALKESFFGGWAGGAGMSGAGRAADVAWAQGRGAVNAVGDMAQGALDKVNALRDKLTGAWENTRDVRRDIEDLLSPKILPSDLKHSDDQSILNWDDADNESRMEKAKRVADKIMGGEASQELKQAAAEFYERASAGAKDAWKRFSEVVGEDLRVQRAREGVERFIDATQAWRKNSDKTSGPKFNAESTIPDTAMGEAFGKALGKKGAAAQKAGSKADRYEQAMYDSFTATLNPKGSVARDTELKRKLFNSIRDTLITDTWNELPWHVLEEEFGGVDRARDAVTKLRENLVRAGKVDDDEGFSSLLEATIQDGRKGERAMMDVVKRYGRGYIGREPSDSELRDTVRAIRTMLLTDMKPAQRQQFDAAMKESFGDNYQKVVAALAPKRIGDDGKILETWVENVDDVTGNTFKNKDVEEFSPAKRFIGSKVKAVSKQNASEDQGKNIVSDHGGFWRIDHVDPEARKEIRKRMATTMRQLRSEGMEVKALSPLEYAAEAGVSPAKIARHLGVTVEQLKDHPARMIMSSEKGAPPDRMSLQREDLEKLAERTKRAVGGLRRIPIEDKEMVGKIASALRKSGAEQRKAMKALGFRHGVKLHPGADGKVYLENNLAHAGNGVFTVHTAEGEYQISAQQLIGMMRERSVGQTSKQNAVSMFNSGLAAIMTMPGFEKVTVKDIWGRDVKNPFDFTLSKPKAEGGKRHLNSPFRLYPDVDLARAHSLSRMSKGTDKVAKLEERLAEIDATLELDTLTDKERSDLEIEAAMLSDELDAEQDRQREYEGEGQTKGLPTDKEGTKSWDVTPLDDLEERQQDFNDDGTPKHPFERIVRRNPEKHVSTGNIGQKFQGVPLRMRAGVSAKHIVENAQKVLDVASRLSKITDSPTHTSSRLSMALDLIARSAAAQKEGDRLARDAAIYAAADSIIQAVADEMVVFRALGDTAAVNKLKGLGASVMDLKARYRPAEHDPLLAEYAPPKGSWKIRPKRGKEFAADRETHHTIFLDTLQTKTGEEIVADGLARKARLERLEAIKVKSKELVDLIELMKWEQELARRELHHRRDRGIEDSVTPADTLKPSRWTEKANRAEKNGRLTIKAKPSDGRKPVKSVDTDPLQRARDDLQGKKDTLAAMIEDGKRQQNLDAAIIAMSEEQRAEVAEAVEGKIEVELDNIEQAVEQKKVVVPVKEGVEQAAGPEARREGHARRKEFYEQLDTLMDAVAQTWQALKKSYVEGRFDKGGLLAAFNKAVVALRKMVGIVADGLREVAREFAKSYASARQLYRDKFAKNVAPLKGGRNDEAVIGAVFKKTNEHSVAMTKAIVDKFNDPNYRDKTQDIAEGVLKKLTDGKVLQHMGFVPKKGSDQERMLLSIADVMREMYPSVKIDNVLVANPRHIYDAFVVPSTGTLAVSERHLKTLLEGKELSLPIVQTLHHEVAHLLDAVADTDDGLSIYASNYNHRLRADFNEWLGYIAKGDLAREAQRVGRSFFTKNAYTYPVVVKDDLVQLRAYSSEIVAQSLAYYATDPEHLKKISPKLYEFAKEVSDAIHSGDQTKTFHAISGISETVRGTGATDLSEDGRPYIFRDGAEFLEGREATGLPVKRVSTPRDWADIIIGLDNIIDSSKLISEKYKASLKSVSRALRRKDFAHIKQAIKEFVEASEEIVRTIGRALARIAHARLYNQAFATALAPVEWGVALYWLLGNVSQDSGARGGKRDNAEGSFASGKGVTAEDMKGVQSYLNKVLGPKVTAMLVKDLGGNSASWERDSNGDALIKIAVNAANPMSKAHHEAMHEFFQRLMDSKSPAADILTKAANSTTVRRQIEQFFHNDPNYDKIKAALNDGHERVAYMYQLWAAGHLNVGPNTKSVFQKVMRILRDIFGILSDDQKAEAILAHFHNGEMSSPNAVASVLANNPKLTSERASALGKVLKPLDTISRNVLWTAQNTLIESDVKAFREIGQLFSTETGKDADGLSFMESRVMKSNQMTGRFWRAIRDLNEKDMELVLEGLQQGKSSNDPKIAEAQGKIRKLLDDIHDYATKAGMELGKVENYFPRVWDPILIAENKQEFVDLLMKDYEDSNGRKLDPKIAESIASRLIRDRGHEPVGETDLAVGFTPFMAGANKRVLSFIKSPEFSKFQEKSLEGIISTYISQTVHKAEYTRRFGQHGEKLYDMTMRGIQEKVGEGWQVAREAAEQRMKAEIERLQKAGKTPEEISEHLYKLNYHNRRPQISHIEYELVDSGAKERLQAFKGELRRYNRAIMAMEGTLGADINPSLRKWQSAIMVYENMRLLGMSLFSQVIDPLGVLVRGGELSDAWKTFTQGVKGTFSAWRGTPMSDAATQLAIKLGTIDVGNYLNTQGNMYTGLYMGKTAQKWNDRLFRWNGVEGFSQGTRVGATMAAVEFLKRHASKPSEHSERWLKELGVTPEDLKLTDGELDYTNPKVQAAIFRWVDGAILRPNAAMRPPWASDPHWALVFHLKQFTYAIQKVFLERVVHEARNGNIAPGAAMIMTFVPTMILADFLRGLAQNGGEEPKWKKNWDFGDYLADGVQRAGLLGVGQIGVDVAQWGPTELIGPFGQHVSKTVNTFRVELARDKKYDEKALSGAPRDIQKAEEFNGLVSATKKVIRDSLPINNLTKNYVYDELVN